MKPEYSNARELFSTVIELESDDERQALLDEVAEQSPELAQKVRELLTAHAKAEGEEFFAANPRLPNEDWKTEEADRPAHERDGTQIGRYKLLEKIGEGGMGAVYMADQEEPVRRRVALKIIKLGMDTKQVVARFEAERQALALMDNPNIAKLLDAGVTENGRPFFVMELVRGVPITTFCDDRKLSIKERLELFIPVCHAIQHAHQKGVIHRDIKPTNVLVTQNGGRPHAMVIDFGVAKATNQRLTEKTLFTRFAQMVGTPAYMSPEQAEMSIHDVDTRSDVYSLGILLYELLTGTPPFPAERLRSAGYAEMQRIIKEEEPPRPSTMMSLMDAEQRTVSAQRGIDEPALVKAIKGDLDWIVLKALEKDRSRRYETANGLAADVARHLNDEPVTARPPTFAYQLQKGWRRNKVIYSAAAMVMASLVLGLTISIWQAFEAIAARKDAESAGQRESELRVEAVAKERQQRLIAYASDMQAANTYLKQNRLEQAERLLARYVPSSESTEDVRGVYWYHLNRALKGQAKQTLPHETMVRGLSLSASGKLLASQTISGKVRLFEAESGRVVHEFGGGLMSYGARDGCVALSPDGQLLASEQHGTLRVWNVPSGELAFQQEDVVAPLGFSPDSKALVGYSAGRLCLWTVSDWASTTLATGPENTIVAAGCGFAFTPDGRHLILAPSRFSSNLVIYDLETNALAGELKGADRPTVLTTNGELVAAGSKSGHVTLWNLSDQAILGQFKAHFSIVLGLALSSDGSVLASGGNEQAIRLWNPVTFESKGSLRGHQKQVWNLQTSGDRQLLASASMDHSVKLWDWLAMPASPKTSPPSVSETPTDPNGSLVQAQPTIHQIRSTAQLREAVEAASPGDRLVLAKGTYAIDEQITIGTPLTIEGPVDPRTGNPDGRAILQGGVGLPFVIQINVEPAGDTELRNLQIEAQASAIQHQSGNLGLHACKAVVRTPLDFKSVLSLEAGTLTPSPTDSVRVVECVLSVEDAGDSPEGTPPNVDVVLASSGSKYTTITIEDSEILNAVPNGISNGIETRSTTAAMKIIGNTLRCQGMAIVLPNHVGTLEVSANKISSGRTGIVASLESKGESQIAGNRVTISPLGQRVYPLFLQDHIAGVATACIRIGNTSAGVTAGFFNKGYVPYATDILVTGNTLAGNPDYGISLVDGHEPENFGPPTPNESHDNVITGNDFTNLDAGHDIAVGSSTHDNRVYANQGIQSVFQEAGADDRNAVSLGATSASRYTLDSIESDALKGNLLKDPATRSLWVWLPPGYDSSPEVRYPVIYLLHGFTGDHDSFKAVNLINVRVGEMATELIASGHMKETIIVLPDASNVYGGSMFGSNEVTGDYLAYIGRDLVGHIDAKYRTLPDREHRAVAGNSMGANGAFSLAMAYPRVFGSIAAMSPSSDYSAKPTTLEKFFEKNPTELEDPTLVRRNADLRGLISANVWVNLLYGRAAALSPNPDNPPYYVDLPVQYPDKEVVSEVWKRWLDQDLVSEIERDGPKLLDTDIFVDVGTGPFKLMEEVHDIAYLRTALEEGQIPYTFVESPGDHLSHLRERTAEVLKFLSDPDAYSPPRPERER